MFRTSRISVLFILLFALSFATPTLAQLDANSAFNPAPCPITLPLNLIEGEDVLCGFVSVPEDHHDPESASIRLAVIVLKDHSSDHQSDPVMLLCGGPGSTCLKDAVATAQILAPLYVNRDFILFDQRGVGFSEPALECPESVQVTFDLLNESDPSVKLHDTVETLFACHDRLVAEGHDLSLYNTQQNAADVELVRRALGYDMVNLYGSSYGSLLAQTVMRDYPAAIRSAVIDSVLPLEASLMVDLSTTTSGALLRLMDTCAADDACDAAYPDLDTVLFDVVDRLNDDPIPITVTNPLDNQTYDALLNGEELLNNLFVFLYDTSTIPALPQVIYDVYQGDYELVTALSSAKLARPTNFSHGMYYSVLCADDLIGRTLDDLLDGRAALPQALQGRVSTDLIAAYSPFAICEHWSVDQADPSVKVPLVSNIPTLAVAGEFDPVTPPEYGALVVEHLPNGLFYSFAGVGHAVGAANECARQVITDFFDNPSNSLDATCVNDLSGVVFDLPSETGAEIVMEAFSVPSAGYSGMAPVGWTQAAPGYFVRGNTSLDQTQLIHDALPMPADELLALLAGQLGFDADVQAYSMAELGNFEWAFYALNIQGYALDLALAEHESRTYFVLLIASAAGRDDLYAQVFQPAVHAMSPLD